MSNNFLTRDQFGFMRGEEFKYVVTSRGVYYVQYGGLHRDILSNNGLDEETISHAGTINSCCKDEGEYLHISYNGNKESLGLNVPTTDSLNDVYSQIEDMFYKRRQTDKEIIRYENFVPIENTESEKPKWNPFGGNR